MDLFSYLLCCSFGALTDHIFGFHFLQSQSSIEGTNRLGFCFIQDQHD